MPRIFVLIFVFTAASFAHAQPVEVTTVRFTTIRPPSGAPGSWLEVDIALNARPEQKGPAPMVSRVRVSLLLGFELPAPPGAERRLEHYRAEAECVALEPGRADVRFYLPPEIVRRDQLHGDPKYWASSSPPRAWRCRRVARLTSQAWPHRNSGKISRRAAARRRP